MSIGPSNPNLVDGRAVRRPRRRLHRLLGRLAPRRLAALALALAASGLVVTPALGADGPRETAELRAAAPAAGSSRRGSSPSRARGPDKNDAFDGGYVAPGSPGRAPSIEIGLSPGARSGSA